LVLRQYLYDLPDAGKRLRLTEAELDAVLAGETPVTPKIDMGLTRLLKTPPGHWVALQADHDGPQRRLDGEQAELEAKVQSPRADFVEQLLQLSPAQRRMLLELYALRTGVRLHENSERQRLLNALQALDRAREALRRRPSSMLDLVAEQLIGLLLDAERWRSGKQSEGARAQRILGPRAAQANEQRQRDALAKAVNGYRTWERGASLPGTLNLVDRVERYCSVKRIGRYDTTRLRDWATTQPLEK